MAFERRRALIPASGVAAVALVAVLVLVLSGPAQVKKSPTAKDSVSPPTAGAVELVSKLGRSSPSPTSELDESHVAASETDFGIGILKQLTERDAGSDTLVSPFSLAEALSMAMVGARGSTQKQIARALDLGNLGLPETSLGWSDLDQDIVGAAAREHDTLRDADSIWTQSGVPVERQFLSVLKTAFGAGVWQVDFRGNPGRAVGEVNEWVKRETDGLIPALLDPDDVNSSTIAEILNAVTFEAQWANQLVPGGNAAFHSPGGTVTTPFIEPPGVMSVRASVSGGLDALEIPYWNGDSSKSSPEGGGRFAALLLMPTSGGLEHFVEGMNPSKLSRIISGLTPTSANFLIPTMDVTATMQLEAPLEAMGMTDAFGPGADFSGISAEAAQISEVKQKANLKVTRWGTVASAATAIGVQASAALSPLMVFDHPFVFLVRDTKTGAILFEATVNDPNSTG